MLKFSIMEFSWLFVSEMYETYFEDALLLAYKKTLGLGGKGWGRRGRGWREKLPDPGNVLAG